MSTFRIPTGDELTALVAPLRPEGSDPALFEEVYARAAWSYLASPGTREVNELLDGEGAIAGLRRHLDLGQPNGQVPHLRHLDALRIAGVDGMLRLSAERGIRILIPGDPLWPTQLDELGAYKPYLLYYTGPDDVIASLNRAVAVVGSRRASDFGREAADSFSAAVVDGGFTVVTAASFALAGTVRAATLRRGGSLVVVTSGGIGNLSPEAYGENDFPETAAHRAVVSETPAGEFTTTWLLVKRNRVIATLAKGVVLLEAPDGHDVLGVVVASLIASRPTAAVRGPEGALVSAGCVAVLDNWEDVTEVVTPDDFMALLTA